MNFSQSAVLLNKEGIPMYQLCPPERSIQKRLYVVDIVIKVKFYKLQYLGVCRK